MELFGSGFPFTTFLAFVSLSPGSLCLAKTLVPLLSLGLSASVKPPQDPNPGYCHPALSHDFNSRHCFSHRVPLDFPDRHCMGWVYACTCIALRVIIWC